MSMRGGIREDVISNLCSGAADADYIEHFGSNATASPRQSADAFGNSGCVQLSGVRRAHNLHRNAALTAGMIYTGAAASPPLWCSVPADGTHRLPKFFRSSLPMTEQHIDPNLIRSRLPYSPITQRPPLRLPKGERVAVWTIVNVENWSPDNAMPRTVLPPPMGQPLLPDIPNWAWHEYGMRVGFWRFLEVLGARNLKASFAVNGSACRVYEAACKAAHEAGWDFIGHGFIQRPMHRVADQRAAIADTIEAIRSLTGKAPRGWESPGLTETVETLDLLAEAGIEFVCDWCLDDQPVRMNTKAGPIVAIPYTVEVNEVVMTAVQGHRSDQI